MRPAIRKRSHQDSHERLTNRESNSERQSGLLVESRFRRACRLDFRFRMEEPRPVTELARPIVAETGLPARAGIPRQREQQQRHKEQGRTHRPMGTGGARRRQGRCMPAPDPSAQPVLAKIPAQKSSTFHLENSHPVRYGGHVFMHRRSALIIERRGGNRDAHSTSPSIIDRRQPAYTLACFLNANLSPVASPRGGHPAVATRCRCTHCRQSQTQRWQWLGISVAKNAHDDRTRRDNKKSFLYCRSRPSNITWSDMNWKVRPAHGKPTDDSMNVTTYQLTPTPVGIKLTPLAILSPRQTSCKTPSRQGLTACVAKNAIRDTMPQGGSNPARTQSPGGTPRGPARFLGVPRNDRWAILPTDTIPRYKGDSPPSRRHRRR